MIRKTSKNFEKPQKNLEWTRMAMKQVKKIVSVLNSSLDGCSGCAVRIGLSGEFLRFCLGPALGSYGDGRQRRQLFLGGHCAADD